MLTREEYADWAKRFAKGQSIVFPQELLALSDWYDVLSHYTMNELEDARLAIARSMQPAPVRFVDYRGWIHRLIHEGRSTLARSEKDDANKWGECVLCHGAGMLGVPHPKCVQGNQWVPLRIAALPPRYFDLAVYCSCRLGQWMHQRYTPRPLQKWRPLSLESYQAMFPGFNWRHAMAKLHAACMAEVRRTIEEIPGFAGDDIRTLGRTMKEMLRKFGREPGCDDE